MKVLFSFLVSSQLVYLITAGIIASGNGVSVAGRLNRDGISSTLIKTHHLTEEDQRRPVNPDLTTSYVDESSAPKNDDSAHFRLYYKSDSPGRSLSHELEHRYIKNPMQRQHYQPSSYQDKLNSFFDSLEQANKLSYSNDFNNNNKKNKKTTLNLHYHGNSDLEFLNNYRNQEQNVYRKNVLKMLLMNLAQNNQRQQQAKQQEDSGLQYKIVHLKFKIEPQQGIIGQGFVETDNGAGSIINSKQFNLLPRELPDLVRRLLLTAQQQHQSNYQTSYTIKKKRSENEMNLDESASNLEKRSVDALKTKMSKPLGTTTNDEDDKINDNEFQESLKSLQRRDDNFELESASSLSDNDADLSADRSARNDDEQSSLEEDA